MTPSGAGNIGDVGSKGAQRKDGDIIPEAAVRPSQDGRAFHTGRGGAGNENGKTSLDKPEEKPVLVGHQSLADKIKLKLASIFKK